MQKLRNILMESYEKITNKCNSDYKQLMKILQKKDQMQMNLSYEEIPYKQEVQDSCNYSQFLTLTEIITKPQECKSKTYDKQRSEIDKLNEHNHKKIKEALKMKKILFQRIKEIDQFIEQQQNDITLNISKSSQKTLEQILKKDNSVKKMILISEDPSAKKKAQEFVSKLKQQKIIDEQQKQMRHLKKVGVWERKMDQMIKKHHIQVQESQEEKLNRIQQRQLKHSQQKYKLTQLEQQNKQFIKNLFKGPNYQKQRQFSQQNLSILKDVPQLNDKIFQQPYKSYKPILVKNIQDNHLQFDQQMLEFEKKIQPQLQRLSKLSHGRQSSLPNFTLLNQY